jgi:DNA-binding NarL/FixJ family response regulator
MTETLIRILIVDDHELFRESVARLLSSEPDLEIAGHCSTVDEAMLRLRQTPVDVVLLDFDLGAENGIRFLDEAASNGFHGRILVVTAGVSEADAAALFARGAAGLFLKHNSALSLTESIRQVYRGNIWLEQRHLSAVLQRGDTAERSPGSKPLTSREMAVLRLVFEGLANKEIGYKLGVSESSVKASLQQLFSKSGVRTRSQLVRFALEHYKDDL